MATEEKSMEELQKMITPQLLERKAQLNKELKKVVISTVRDAMWGLVLPAYAYLGLMHYLLGQTEIGVIGANIYFISYFIFRHSKHKQARTKEYQDLLALCKPVKGKHQR